MLQMTYFLEMNSAVLDCIYCVGLVKGKLILANHYWQLKWLLTEENFIDNNEQRKAIVLNKQPQIIDFSGLSSPSN